MFDMYNLKLYAVACNYMSNKSDAQEVMQESWIEIFKSIKNYSEKGNLHGWLKTIVIRVCWKMIRANKNHMSIENVHEVSFHDQAQQIHDKMTCEEMMNLLECLPAMMQTVFKLFVIEQYSHLEISKILDINESTSRVHLSKARKILKKQYFNMNQISENGL